MNQQIRIKETVVMSGAAKRKLSKTSIAYVAVGVIMITLMTIVGMSAFLRAAEISVEGASAYTVEMVIEASGLSIGDNLMFINLQNASQQIRSELPFVKEANVVRILPDKVVIEVVESKAVARVTSAGWLYVIDSSCRVLASAYGSNDEEIVLSSSSGDIYSLIEIRGLEIEESTLGSTLKPVFGAETKLQYTQDVLSALEREGIADDVSYVDVSNIVNVYFGYLGRYRVILGGSTSLRPSNIRHNLVRLVESIPTIEERYPNTIGDIDLSDESAPPKFTPTS